jgi:hypothetical protein
VAVPYRFRWLMKRSIEQLDLLLRAAIPEYADKAPRMGRRLVLMAKMRMSRIC